MQVVLSSSYFDFSMPWNLDAKLFYVLPFVTPTMMLDDFFLLRKFFLNLKPLGYS
jgi:hypothetical protein